MKKIGNIVVSSNSMKIDGVFNKCTSYDDIDIELPTLIIGLDNARKYIEGFNILDKEYGNFYWTFKKNERRDDHEIDIQKFYELCLERITSEVTYRYLNLIQMGYTSIRNLIKYISGSRHKVCSFTKDKSTLFIYDSERKIVYGVSMSLIEYMGIDTKKITRMVFSNHMNEYAKEYSFLTERMKKIVANDQYLVPVFYEYFFN